MGTFHIGDHVAALFRFAGERKRNLSPDGPILCVGERVTSTSMLELGNMVRRASVRGGGLSANRLTPPVERQRKAFQRDEGARNSEMRLPAEK